MQFKLNAIMTKPDQENQSNLDTLNEFGLLREFGVAMKKMVDTYPENQDPSVPLATRVTRAVDADNYVREVLCTMFSDRELATLTGILVDFFRDTLATDETLDEFLEELAQTR